MRVRVLRAFLVAGKVHSPGSEVDLPENLGLSVLASNKAERVASQPPVSEPMTTKTAEALAPASKASTKGAGVK